MSFFEFPHTRTYDSDLGWLIKEVHTLDEVTRALDNWVEEYQPKIEDFEKLYLMLISGRLPESIQKGIEIWMQDNAIDLVGQLIKSVFFAIDDNGYFIAYIPDSWAEIDFGTSGLDDFPPNVDFGHLTLSY